MSVLLSCGLPVTKILLARGARPSTKLLELLYVTTGSAKTVQGAMMMRPRFMRPCKSLSLDDRSLFVASLLVKNKSGSCFPVLIGPHKLGPNEHGILVPMVNTLRNVESTKLLIFTGQCTKYL